MHYIDLRSYLYLVPIACAKIDLLMTSKYNIDTTEIKLLFVLNVPFSSLQILPQLLQWLSWLALQMCLYFSA